MRHLQAKTGMSECTCFWMLDMLNVDAKYLFNYKLLLI